SADVDLFACDVGTDRQEPVGVVRERAQKDAATPTREGPQPCVRRAAEEVDRPVLQGLRWIRRREDELHVDAFLLKEPELYGGDGHEVGRSERVSNGEPNRILFRPPGSYLNIDVIAKHDADGFTATTS